MDFSDLQIERYSRNMILKEVGGKGQERLLNGRVLIIGAGGLGSPCALYLAAAGVGTIGIVDSDKVDLSNLQRQIIHFTKDIGKKKVISAKEKIEALNPDIRVNVHPLRMTSENIRETIKDYHFVVDGTDNFASKFLINDACYFEKKPFSHGGILRFYGQTITYVPGTTCLRCLFPAPPPLDQVPTCSQAGVLGVVAGILGTIQAAEAIKYLLGAGSLLVDRIQYIDIFDMNFQLIKVKRNDDCPLCGKHPKITELKDEVEILCDLRGGN